MTPSESYSTKVHSGVVRVSGLPATFATAGEKPWKEAIGRELEGQNETGNGLAMRFILPEGGHPKRDLDNFCAPVFSVLAGQLGWFGGRRPNIKWWYATKETGRNPGVELKVFPERNPPTQLSGETILDQVYNGPLPTRGSDAPVPMWLEELGYGGTFAEDGPFSVELHFTNPKINLGDISTGPVKSLIDCLYPILGGKVSDPDDWKIVELLVSKGSENGVGAVHIRLSVASGAHRWKFR